MNNWFELQMKRLGYKGCRNCKNQIAPLIGCEWLEKGGDGQIHLVCPRWEKKEEKNEDKKYIGKSYKSCFIDDEVEK